MEPVCWICGYSIDERREQGAEPGKCPIPAEVAKPQACCLLADPKLTSKGVISALLACNPRTALMPEPDPSEAVDDAVVSEAIRAMQGLAFAQKVRVILAVVPVAMRDALIVHLEGYDASEP
jgi:hypothetical protein